MKHGFIKVAAAVPTVSVGDCQYNLMQIENLIAQAEGKGVEIIVFPELSLTGYTCQDLFRQNLLIDAAEQSVMMLLDFTRQLDIIAIVGLPIAVGDLLLNCAAVIQKGQLLGVVPKTYLPNYSEFYEKRWFASAQDLRHTTIRFAGATVVVSPSPQLFRTCDGVVFGVEICEDVWAPVPPSNNLAIAGADMVFNLSASDELIGKHNYLCSLLSQQSARTITGYIYASSGFGESTQDVVYGGNALIYENGRLVAEGERFSMNAQMVTAQIDVEMLRAERRGNSTYVNAQRDLKAVLSTNLMGNSSANSLSLIECRTTDPHDFCLERAIDPLPFVPRPDEMSQSCRDIFTIQQMGLAKRLVHTGCKSVVIGISGGLDSTLALLVCVGAFDRLKLERRGIVGVTMPGFGTTDRTYHNAMSLMKELGISIREISIKKSVMQHFEDIGHNADNHDVTYENSQARERTQILMDVSNQVGGFVVGTGDLSELALGWATYNGDHMSMYGVNAGVPKTLIQHLVRHVAGQYAEKADGQEVSRTLLDIVDTPISPELIPANEKGEIQQKTEDLVGPYELHDFFLFYFLRYGFSPEKIFLLAQQAFQQKEVFNRNAGHYDDATIRHWLKTFLRRFFAQQFKRSCLPDGPKIGSVSLSPRGDWRMPSDAAANIWLRQTEELA